jgi:hypothetical protein
MPKLNCQHCAKGIQGRSDKKYCSVQCKNDFNQALKLTTFSAIRHIDGILHKNHQILATILGSRPSVNIARFELESMGFNFNYHTSIYTNTHNKQYYYIYDYAWMGFSTQTVTLYKMTKVHNGK